MKFSGKMIAVLIAAGCLQMGSGCGQGAEKQAQGEEALQEAEGTEGQQDLERTEGLQDLEGTEGQQDSEGLQDSEEKEGEKGQKEAEGKPGQQDPEAEKTDAGEQGESEEKNYINPSGMTLSERVGAPDGYARVEAEAGGFQEFLRDYPMKEHGSPILRYDGSPLGYQSIHCAIFDLPLGTEDLQQCADSVIRMYAEYFWKTGQFEKISFHFTNGFEAAYTKWRDGGRIHVDGNDVYWTEEGAYDDSYENFEKYLTIVFAYAGTLSMEGEAEPTDFAHLKAGDVFLSGGSPGHVVMVVDVCENEAGKKAFLLAQGFMPAQNFHLLKNPAHEDDPWYYEEEVKYPFQTPAYTFQEGSLKKLCYGEEELR